jgi:hypothetical protein
MLPWIEPGVKEKVIIPSGYVGTDRASALKSALFRSGPMAVHMAMTRAIVPPKIASASP